MVDSAMHKRLEEMTILVTGGTGSFGRTMVERLLKRGCGEIRVLSRDECKQDQMRTEIADERVKFYIGDVRDRASVDGAMHGVDCVFHAAALKQVPSCEFFPIEAVRTNVLGSQNVVASAIMGAVRNCVFLSTDKAVYPINAMGMSKALMEKVVSAESRQLKGSSTVLSCVRYGNVMCSRGSVIPLFMRQIKERKALTVTDPQMTRFMLSLVDAIDLVEFALENADNGDLFVRKAPACTIEELARVMLEIFDADVGIKVIGIRHGEKLYETLASREELVRADDMGDYFRVRPDDRDLNYGKYFTEGNTDEASLEDYNSHNAKRIEGAALRDLLLSLPEVRAAAGKGAGR